MIFSYICIICLHGLLLFWERYIRREVPKLPGTPLLNDFDFVIVLLKKENKHQFLGFLREMTEMTSWILSKKLFQIPSSTN